MTCAQRPRIRGHAGLVVCALFCLVAARAHADAGWFASGDTQLRLDLQLLNDAEVIRLPVSYWPLPRASVIHALDGVRDQFVTNRAVAAALERVRARVAAPERRGLSFEAGVRGGDPGIWRDFDTLARENGEIGVGAGFDGDAWSLGLELTGVTDPADGEEIRLDGSQATMKLGNWLVSAHALDRWWGPGHEGSLILSNNARPMPTLMVERAEARPWEIGLLNWLGPWRMSLGLSQMEGTRQDLDSPLFLAWRFVVMPTKKMEFGFSRTAQFCGDGRKCDFGTLVDIIIGDDNVGLDVSPEDEPGNQMAGFDMRWNSPIGNLPYAFYGQYIGEDESSYFPAKFLRQLGAEIWHPFPDGGIAQVYLEWTNTTCTGNSRFGQRWGCSYKGGPFNIDGYRYRGRNIGYTADRDSYNWALGSIYAAPGGSTWTATARYSKFSRGTDADPTNPVASVPTEYGALEFGWKGRFFGEQVSVDLGVQSVEPLDAERDTRAYGFVSWRHAFTP